MADEPVTPEFEIRPASDIDILVELRTAGPRVTGYTVLLRAYRDGAWREVRLWDTAHGLNEMHRFGRAAGKQPGIVLHHGSLAEGYRVAYAEAQERFREIVESWERS